MNNNITDEQALEALKSTATGRAQVADTFATRTILYPVEIERRKGVKVTEIRPYVIAGQYYSARRWKKAQDVEKRYAQLNKAYRENLKARKLPIERREVANPLNLSPLDLK